MLNNKQKRFLKAEGNSLRAIFQVGKEGTTPNLFKTIDDSLTAHELIKISTLKTCPQDVREVAIEIAAATKSEIVQIIGRTVLLYRASKERKKDSAPMKRVAILGGTFDPIHQGHLLLAKMILKRLKVNEVWFMPALLTPLKDRKLTDFKLRVKMIKKAIQPYRKMKVSLLEASLPTPSYTINTVLELKKRYPETKFYWIIGADQAVKLHQWKDSERLKDEVQLVCVSRDQTALVKEDKIIYIDNFDVPCSSTEVRQGTWSQVSKPVRRIMIENALYLEELLSSVMSEHRKKHSQSVAEVALMLAKAHGVDSRQAWMAGMLHDVAKEMDKKRAEEIMKVIHPDKLSTSPKIWHQWLAEDVLRHQLQITEHKICSAVANHVLGIGKGKLDKILFIADKIDPLRGYDIHEQLSISLKDLNAGLKRIQDEQKNYLKQKEGIDVRAA